MKGGYTMYVGNIKQWEDEIPYLPNFLLPWIRKLAKADISSLVTGRHELGHEHFMNVDEGATAPATERLMEAHEKYIDIQMVITGDEIIGYQPLCNAGDRVESYPEKDGYFYNPDPALDTPIHMVPGTFAIFMPGDGHRALCAPEGTGAPIRKVILKIHI